MKPDDHGDFVELLQGVHSFYGRDLTKFALGVWWQALRPFDLVAVRDAMGRHVVNPDTGQFMPKPADITRMIGGRTVDAAQQAWAKVDWAIRSVGTYTSVAFDDPLIHRVASDMGGWVLLGTRGDTDWPFVAKEFETRYRGYAMRSEIPPYPAHLSGIIEHENGHRGYPAPEPVLIGDADRARRVLEHGAATTGPAVLRANDTKLLEVAA